MRLSCWLVQNIVQNIDNTINYGIYYIQRSVIV